jgi:hypothetical protein
MGTPTVPAVRLERAVDGGAQPHSPAQGARDLGMKDDTSDRRGWPGLRHASAAAALAGLALLAAACGGGSSPASSAGGTLSLSSLTTQALAYAQCMRAHGITNFPDPFENSNQIGFSTTGLDTSSPRFKAANKACQPLMPGGGP